MRGRWGAPGCTWVDEGAYLIYRGHPAGRGQSIAVHRGDTLRPPPHAHTHTHTRTHAPHAHTQTITIIIGNYFKWYLVS